MYFDVGTMNVVNIKQEGGRIMVTGNAVQREVMCMMDQEMCMDMCMSMFCCTSMYRILPEISADHV